MPIRFSCHECGKQLQTQDDFAGKKVRCPGCKIVLDVPGEPTGVTSTPGVSSTPASSSPPTSSADEGLRDRPSATRPRDDRTTSEPTARTTPRRPKKKKSSPMVLVLLLGIVLLIGGGVAGGYYYFLTQQSDKKNDNRNGGPPPNGQPGPMPGAPIPFQFQASYKERDLGTAKDSHLAMIPTDANFFFTIRMHHVLENLPENVQKYLKVLPKSASPFEWVKSNCGFDPQEVERFSVVAWAPKELDEPTPSWVRVLVFVTTEKPYDVQKLREQFADDPTTSKPDGRTFLVRTDLFWKDAPKFKVHLVDKTTFVVGDSKSIEETAANKKPAKTDGKLARGLELAKKNHALVLSVVNPEVVQQLDPKDLPLPKAKALIEGVLTEGLKQSLQLKGFDLVFDNDAKAFDLQMLIHFPNEKEAKTFAESVRELGGPIGEIQQAPARERPKLAVDMFRPFLPRMGKAPGPPAGEPKLKQADINLVLDVLEGINVVQKDNVLRLGVVIQPPTMKKILAKVPDPLIKSAVEAMPTFPPLPARPKKLAPGQLAVAKNLRDLAIAMHAYHDVLKKFPGQSIGKGLSWRVAILPHLGKEGEELYKKFKLDEKWDSEHNKKLIAEMPKVFQHPTAKAEEGHTFYQGVAGPDTIFEPGKQFPLVSIQDGTSYTLMFLETAKAVPWTKPEDVSYDPKAKKLPDFGGHFAEKVVAAMADGAVYVLPHEYVQKNFQLLVQKADGQPIPDFPTKPVSFNTTPKTKEPKPKQPQMSVSPEQRDVAKKLRQLVLATHNYHDIHRKLPSQSIGKGLSWRVAILPHVGKEGKELFDKFKLDEKWDSEHNKKLIAEMPKIFLHPKTKTKKGHTFFQAVAGKDTVLSNGGGKLGHIVSSDGTVNTMMFLEAKKAVPWTKPEDLPYDPKDKKLPAFGGHFKGEVVVAMVDGTVHIMSEKGVRENFGLLANWRDGQVIPDFPRRQVQFPGSQPKKTLKGKSEQKSPKKKGVSDGDESEQTNPLPAQAKTAKLAVQVKPTKKAFKASEQLVFEITFRNTSKAPVKLSVTSYLGTQNVGRYNVRITAKDKKVWRVGRDPNVPLPGAPARLQLYELKPNKMLKTRYIVPIVGQRFWNGGTEKAPKVTTRRLPPGVYELSIEMSVPDGKQTTTATKFEVKK